LEVIVSLDVGDKIQIELTLTQNEVVALQAVIDSISAAISSRMVDEALAGAAGNPSMHITLGVLCGIHAKFEKSLGYLSE
jgi:hypothetical protein